MLNTYPAKFKSTSSNMNIIKLIIQLFLAKRNIFNQIPRNTVTYMILLHKLFDSIKGLFTVSYNNIMFSEYYEIDKI